MDCRTSKQEAPDYAIWIRCTGTLFQRTRSHAVGKGNPENLRVSSYHLIVFSTCVINRNTIYNYLYFTCLFNSSFFLSVTTDIDEWKNCSPKADSSNETASTLCFEVQRDQYLRPHRQTVDLTCSYGPETFEYWPTGKYTFIGKVKYPSTLVLSISGATAQNLDGVFLIG